MRSVSNTFCLKFYEIGHKTANLLNEIQNAKQIFFQKEANCCSDRSRPFKKKTVEALL